MVKERETICPNCEDVCVYDIREEKKTVVVKGLAFEISIKVAVCNKCGEQVFPDDIEKENDLIIFDEYRRLKGLLTSDEIKNIRKKRGMTQVELSRFINAGDKNVARYETGTIQDPAFDALLRMVNDDDCYNAMCLLRNKLMKKRMKDIQTDARFVYVLTNATDYRNIFKERKITKKGGNKSGKIRIKNASIPYCAC